MTRFLASLYKGVSVGRSVGPSVGNQFFFISEFYHTTINSTSQRFMGTAYHHITTAAAFSPSSVTTKPDASLFLLLFLPNPAVIDVSYLSGDVIFSYS